MDLSIQQLLQRFTQELGQAHANRIVAEAQAAQLQGQVDTLKAQLQQVQEPGDHGTDPG